MNYEDWLKNVPGDITEDALWTVKAYRYALFLSDLGWHDVTKLMQDKRTLDLSDQLYRAEGSISANIAEGYSRSTGKDRARFYEYALDQLARVAIGIIRHGMSWVKKLHSIA